MNSKTLVAIAVGAVASFLLGWLVWGILLMDYYQANTITYDGMMLEKPILWAIFISNIAGATTLGWLFQRMNVTTFGDGFKTGAILWFLYAASINLMFYAMMNWYANTSVMFVDMIVNGVFGGVIGGIMGMMMGRGGAK
jgi:hypothetical protein